MPSNSPLRFSRPVVFVLVASLAILVSWLAGCSSRNASISVDDYKRSCSTDDECVVVQEGDVCGCGESAGMHQSAQREFSQDKEEKRQTCSSTTACGAGRPLVVAKARCKQGTCRAVRPDVSSELVGPEGATLELGETTLDVPADALEEKARLRIIERREWEGLPERYSSVSNIYNFQFVIETLQKPIEVRFQLDEPPEDGPLALFLKAPVPDSSSWRYVPFATTQQGTTFRVTIDRPFEVGFVGTMNPCHSADACEEDVPCSEGYCYVPACSDGRRNGLETDIDCGSRACGPCESGSPPDVGSRPGGGDAGRADTTGGHDAGPDVDVDDVRDSGI